MRLPMRLSMAAIQGIGFLALLLLGTTGLAASSPAEVEAKVKSDLEDIIGRMVSKERFSVQVSTDVDTVSERKLLEGETIIQNNPANAVVVPPLPGFQPAPTQAQANPGQNRQVFRMVDKEVVRSIQAFVSLDETLDPAVVDQVRKAVQQYFALAWKGKGQAQFSAIKILAPTFGHDASGSWWPWVVAGLGVLVLALALLAFWLAKSAARKKVVYPTVMSGSGEEIYDAEVQERPASAKGSSPSLEGGRRPVALPAQSSGARAKGGFPALPATQDFVDRRTQLLQLFLRHAEIFRLYHQRLPVAAQEELYAGLRGPAFDSLLESLELPIPEGVESGAPPSEEQMLFYINNFNEFLEINSWQEQRFFGFLRQMSDDQLLLLVHQENPIVGALIIKSLKPQQSAAVLNALSSEKRSDILGQFSRIGMLSTEELTAIENSVRERVTKLPRFFLGYSTDEDISFWSRILAHSEKQDEILMDLEKSRPDLYPALAKFRFKLEDLPSLPQPLIQKVLDEVDNETLALALLGCSRDVVDFALNECPVDRKDLITSHLTMLNGMPAERIKEAKMGLTVRFREVMV